MRMCKIYGEVELLAVAPTSRSPPVHPRVNAPPPSTTPTPPRPRGFLYDGEQYRHFGSKYCVRDHSFIKVYCGRVGVSYPVDCTLTYSNRNYFPDLSEANT